MNIPEVGYTDEQVKELAAEAMNYCGDRSVMFDAARCQNLGKTLLHLATASIKNGEDARHAVDVAWNYYASRVSFIAANPPPASMLLAAV